MPSEDSKPVKKEEVLGDQKDACILENRNKKSTNNPTPKSLPSKQTKVKKQEADDDDFGKPTTKKSSNLIDKKNSMIKEEGKKRETKEVEQSAKKRGRKVYDLPGQKRDPPEERDPVRIFYETLYEQVPGSELAAFWMMESGLLSKEVAKKVYEKKLKKPQLQKLGTPMKPGITIEKSSLSVSVKRKTPSPPASSQKKVVLDFRGVSKQFLKPQD